MMREFLTLDSSKFPIVVGIYNKFIPTPEEFTKAQTDVENFCMSHEDFVLVLDFSVIPILSSEYRIAQAKWAAKTDALFVKQKMRIAFYTPSIITQVVLKSVFILSKPGIPYTLASTLEKAHVWAAKQLALKPHS
jgi:hypothetical protein